MKSGFYMTAGDDKLSGWTEKKLQSTSQGNTCTRKGSWSRWWSAAIWSTIAFWIPGKPFHLRSVLSKSMRHTENCNTCLWYWAIEWAQFFSTTTPDHMVHNQRFRSWMNWATKFHLIRQSPDISPTDYHFFGHLENFLQGKRFHNRQEAETAFPEFIRSWSMDFFFLLYFSLAKMCWLWWFLFWLIMMCLSLVIVT